MTTAVKKVEPKTFQVRAPILANGTMRDFYVETDHFRFGVVSVSPTYPDGRPRGEEELHYHPEEDHAFLVLQGRARFSFQDRPDVVVSPWEGIFLPREFVYAFVVEGDEGLVMLRASGLNKPLPSDKLSGYGTPLERLDPEGKPLERDLFPRKDPLETVLGAFFPG